MTGFWGNVKSIVKIFKFDIFWGISIYLRKDF